MGGNEGKGEHGGGCSCDSTLFPSNRNGQNEENNIKKQVIKNRKSPKGKGKQKIEVLQTKLRIGKDIYSISKIEQPNLEGERLLSTDI